MRIVHIEKFLPPTGGVGSYLRRLTELQRARGHQVLQFGCVGAAGPPDMPVFEDFTVSRGPAALGRMIHNQQAVGSLDAFLRRHPADVAHLHNIYHHLSPSILPVLARRRMGIVMTVHDYRLACPTKFFLRPDGPCTRCLPNKFYHAASPRCAGLGGAGLALESCVQRVLRRYWRWVDALLCPTRFLRDVLIRCGAPAAKAVVFRNVIPVLPLPADVPRRGDEILWAGRLSPEKDPLLALELAARLPTAQVMLAGDGPLIGRLRQELAARKLTNVTLTGLLSPSELGRHLARATAVLLTSRWFENSPQIMLEAMAAGRCVIVPDHPPLREFVQDGRTGRLFRSGDAEALAHVTAEVLGGAGRRRTMEQAARELTAKRHDGEALMDQLDGLYEEAIRRCALR